MISKNCPTAAPLPAYSPTNPTLDGTFRKITVMVNAPGRPTVRTRNGYYSSPASRK